MRLTKRKKEILSLYKESYGYISSEIGYPPTASGIAQNLEPSQRDDKTTIQNVRRTLKSMVKDGLLVQVNQDGIRHQEINGRTVEFKCIEQGYYDPLEHDRLIAEYEHTPILTDEERSKACERVLDKFYANRPKTEAEIAIENALDAVTAITDKTAELIQQQHHQKHNAIEHAQDFIEGELVDKVEVLPSGEQQFLIEDLGNPD